MQEKGEKVEKWCVKRKGKAVNCTELVKKAVNCTELIKVGTQSHTLTVLALVSRFGLEVEFVNAGV